MLVALLLPSYYRRNHQNDAEYEPECIIIIHLKDFKCYFCLLAISNRIKIKPPRNGQPLQGTNNPSPKCPLFRGFTVDHASWFTQMVNPGNKVTLGFILPLEVWLMCPCVGVSVVLCANQCLIASTVHMHM